MESFDRAKHLESARINAARSNKARGLDRALDVMQVWNNPNLTKKQKAEVLKISPRSMENTVYRARKRIELETQGNTHEDIAEPVQSHTEPPEAI